MDEDDDLYGGTGVDVKAESTPAVKTENEVDMDGDQEEEEEEEESDDVGHTNISNVWRQKLIVFHRTSNLH